MDFGSIAAAASATGPDDVGTSAAASSVPTDGVREAGEFGGGNVVTVRDDGDGDETVPETTETSRDGVETETRRRRDGDESRRRRDRDDGDGDERESRR